MGGGRMRGSLLLDEAVRMRAWLQDLGVRMKVE